jgi:hypothetical protein
MLVYIYSIKCFQIKKPSIVISLPNLVALNFGSKRNKKIHTKAVPFRTLAAACHHFLKAPNEQFCQIFIGENIPNSEKNIPNWEKIHQMKTTDTKFP